MNLYIALVFLLLVVESQCGVMQITLNNLHNVLTTYEQLFILFHNPQCTHSRKYVENFLKIDSSQKLGIVDCLREIQLCNKYNYTYFPLLARFFANNSQQVVDEQQFLVSNGLKNGKEDQVMINKFVRYLETDQQYAVIVFEHHGLPTISSQRLSQNEQRIFYLQPQSDQNPSNFTKMVSSFVDNKPGCWIFKKSATNKLDKYYCDSGYNKTITKKFINLFRQDKIKKFVFSQQQIGTKDSLVKQYTALDLYNILETLNRADTSICTLIYFSSSHCPSCRTRDISNVQWVLESLKIHNQLHFAIFNIDQNEIPPKLVKLGFKRVPELVYICNQNIQVFGEIFFLEKITHFLSNHHLGNNKEGTLETRQKQESSVQTQIKDQDL